MKPTSSSTNTQHANGGNGITRVDNCVHAESVIKSLRSLSLSQSRYQRNAEDSDVIVSSLSKFDSIISSSINNNDENHNMSSNPVTAYLNATSSTSATISQTELTASRSKQPAATIGQTSVSDSDEDDEDYDNLKFSKSNQSVSQQPPAEAKVAANSSAASKSREFNDDEDMDGLSDDEDRELFDGFVAPQVSKSKAGNTTANEKSKFSNKLNSSVALAQSYQSNDFGLSNPRIIVKPGQRIVVKARSRKSNGSDL